MTATKKPQYKTEKVVKDDGSVVNICRCALADMDTLLELQDRLVEAYILADGALGEIIAKPEVQADLKSICSLLPLDQKVKGETVYLDFEDIKDNWEQLVALFFNGAIDETSRKVEAVSPSKVSKLHFLPYQKMLEKHLKSLKETQKEDS